MGKIQAVETKAMSEVLHTAAYNYIMEQVFKKVAYGQRAWSMGTVREITDYVIFDERIVDAEMDLQQYIDLVGQSRWDEVCDFYVAGAA